ncbi:MAG TPA: hypothetical protein V6D17_20640 [Candidatus Obscuribacterales bacterium]
MKVGLDDTGEYVILATVRAASAYTEAVRIAKALHPKAELKTFAPGNLDALLPFLKQQKPRYALIFMTPDELDTNFAWRWLPLTTKIDDDPFVDVRTGFITGATAKDVFDFMQRIKHACVSKMVLHNKMIDNLGLNQMASKDNFQTFPMSNFVPVFSEAMPVVSISHGCEGFTEKHLDTMDGAGLLHFGGHGWPDRVEDGITAGQAGKLKIAPCIVFSGACYTGVTRGWWSPWSKNGSVKHNDVAPDRSFCLKLLGNNVLAYFAALHADHGCPVYQEMEYLAFTGAPLGDAIKNTHDGVVLGSGGKLPPLPFFVSGQRSPQLTPAQIMLYGSASRILFGDPAMTVMPGFTAPPFKISAVSSANKLQAVATLSNNSLKPTFTDTYYCEMSRIPGMFNDAAVLSIPLANGTAVSNVTVEKVDTPSGPQKHRLVGYGVETDGGQSRLRLQIDLPSDGFLQSKFRANGSSITISAWLSSSRRRQAKGNSSTRAAADGILAPAPSF